MFVLQMVLTSFLSRAEFDKPAANRFGSVNIVAFENDEEQKYNYLLVTLYVYLKLPINWPASDGSLCSRKNEHNFKVCPRSRKTRTDLHSKLLIWG